MANQHHYKLIYFDFYGRAEYIRYIFAYGGISYEEERISFEEWPSRKPDMPFGTVPLLIVDHRKLWIGQHTAIGRYLARQLDLCGKNAEEAAQADMYVEASADLYIPFAGHGEELYFGVKTEKNIQLTWADIYVAQLLKDMGSYFQEDLLSGYPELKNYVERIHAVPSILKYTNERKVHKF